MADIYFDLTSGNDTTGDGSSGNPYQTLSKVNTVASNGDTAILKDGTYTLSADVSTSITKNLTITSESGNPKSCIIDGNSTYYYEIRVGANNLSLSIENITFQNGIYGSTKGAFYCSNYTGGTYLIENCIFKNNSTVTVLIGNIGTGGQNSSLTVKQCLFEDNFATTVNGRLIGLGTGALGSEDNWQVYIYQNTIIQNSNNFTGSGYVYTRYNTINFKNNIFYVNQTTALSIVSVTVAAGPTYFYNNCYHQAGAGAVSLISTGSVTVDSNNITSDPLFVDITTNDYRLRPSSPCMDTGTAL